MPLVVDVPAAPSAPLASAGNAETSRAPLREPPAIVWNAWEPAVEDRARAEHKPLLVFAYAAWSEACHQLDANVFPSLEVRRAAQSYVTVKVDLTDTDNAESVDIMLRLHILSMPTILLIDDTTNARDDIKSFVDERTLAERMTHFSHSR